MGKQELANPRSELVREITARGLLEQASDLEALDAAFAGGMVTFYIGYDPTAPSLHVGHLVPIMAMRLLQRHGHRPICLVGGGTARVGDPSGKTETRRMLTADQISANAAAIKAQLNRFIHFDTGAPNDAIMVDNADWLLSLQYIDFLRDIGRHFSVNRMVATKTYRERLESEQPLSFLEFNYQLLQSYDFMRLYMDHDCILQVGGADQWGNMIAGVELIRRVRHATGEAKSDTPPGEIKKDAAHALTLQLLTTADGRKMGKTEKGAIWLEAEQLSPYDYYQFWYNTADADVAKMFRTFTDVPVDEIDDICAHEGAALNQAKTRLALEATALLHGEEAAQSARRASEQAFGGSSDWSALPCVELGVAEITLGDLLVHESIAAFKSKRLARQSVQAGSVKVNDTAISEINERLTAADCGESGLRLQASKKKKFVVKLSS
jgi:tyrosyl-tRNA synthetase